MVGARNALNCYWPMPFKKHAVLTVANEGERGVNNFYFNIDYRLEQGPQADARYFHTQYRAWFPAPVGKPLTRRTRKASRRGGGNSRFRATDLSAAASAFKLWPASTRWMGQTVQRPGAAAIR
jgi:hypothetical protein